MLSILITHTYYSILTFSGVNKRRKIEKTHETSPKFMFFDRLPP